MLNECFLNEWINKWAYVLRVQHIGRCREEYKPLSLPIFITPYDCCRQYDLRASEETKHLNAEFQRIARRVKKAFLSDQCKEIEANNRMGKTRDTQVFKKIRDTKGKFHAKTGLIKDRNGMDLT